jgi:energy-coupling factor transport system permease protein
MRLPWVWVIWLATVLVLLSITRNFLYLVIILLCVVIIGLGLQKNRAELPRPFLIWKYSLWIILFASLFNALTSHYGETVFFTIPGKVPLLSGDVTLEAVVYGATNGLILIGMLASFMVLNLALPVRDLISLIPGAFFPVAVITSIAVTYLPTTLRQFQQIREAQAIRGHQMKSLGDWLPLLMPLLVGGLEHAIQLAEAMTARGFASTKGISSEQRFHPRFLILAGVLSLAAGWIIRLGKKPEFGIILIGMGALLIVVSLWQHGKQSHRTIYHRSSWGWQDILTVVVMVCILAIFLLPIVGINRESLYFEPYPLLVLPKFDPLLGLVTFGLLTPGLFALNKKPAS